MITTCAYCGVGCSFRAEMKGQEVVRMMPNKDGHANHGHSCVKGRFAFGYATHKDRIQKPMIRETIHEPWREVSWEEAFDFRQEDQGYPSQIRQGLRRRHHVVALHQRGTYLVQKLVRAAFGNNNVDTCARVCHSPTGYGLKTTLGESAGTQSFDSVMKSDCVIVIGANPTDAHPVFASQMKRRLREGAKLIVVDPREIDLVRSPHVQASITGCIEHPTSRWSTRSHVIVTEGLRKKEFIMNIATSKFTRLARVPGVDLIQPEHGEGPVSTAADSRRGADVARFERRDLLWPRRHRHSQARPRSWPLQTWRCARQLGREAWA